MYTPSPFIDNWLERCSCSKDEPQHLTKGKITRNLLKLSGIKYCILNNDKSLKKLSQLLKYSKKNNVPVACLIKKNTFNKNKTHFVDKNKNLKDLKRDIIIKELLKKVRNTKIISSTGYISRELFRLSSSQQKENNFYVVGGMGHCSMIALGYSLFSKKQVLCLDGDGSMLMHLGSIFTIGQHSKKILNIFYSIIILMNQLEGKKQIYQK